MNAGRDPFSITKGDRIAQLVVSAALLPEVLQVTGLQTTDRGDGGLGSTGIK
jgi:dUTP pyrophosphatase